jgi:hypothetical protein
MAQERQVRTFPFLRCAFFVYDAISLRLVTVRRTLLPEVVELGVGNMVEGVWCDGKRVVVWGDGLGKRVVWSIQRMDVPMCEGLSRFRLGDDLSGSRDE